LTPEQIDKAISSPYPSVRESTVHRYYQQLSFQQKDKLISDPSDDVRLALVTLMEDPTEDQIKRWINDFNHSVRKISLKFIDNLSSELVYQVAQRELQERAVRKEDYNPKASEEMGL